jgi:hypothetical protein
LCLGHVASIGDRSSLAKWCSPDAYRIPPNAAGAEIVRVAQDKQLAIVTGNGPDFEREIKAFIAQSKKVADGCHEVFGLVVLPNGYEHQRRILQDVESKLKFDGESVTWADVAERNLYVKVNRTGKVHVKKLPRCPYCIRNEGK